MPESLQPYEIRVEALAERLNLRAQWEARVKSLFDVGILEILPDCHKLGCLNIEAEECPIPTYEEIKQRLTPETLELMETKVSQGFTRLQLTPLTMPLKTMIELYKALLIKKHQQGKLLSTKGDQLPLDPDNPLYFYDAYQGADLGDNSDQGLVYYPKQFTGDHQGQTKKELIQAEENWQVELIEDLPDLPAENQGQEISGRHQLEANHSPNEYLRIIQTDPSYRGEQGFTLEDWLTYAIAKLEEDNIQPDDFSGQGKACYNIGSYLPAGSGVPRCSFGRGSSRAYLRGYGADCRRAGNSVRSSVKIP